MNMLNYLLNFKVGIKATGRGRKKEDRGLRMQHILIKRNTFDFFDFFFFYDGICMNSAECEMNDQRVAVSPTLSASWWKSFSDGENSVRCY